MYLSRIFRLHDRRVDVPIPNSIMGQWSHHPAATASVQVHTSIRRTIDTYTWPKGTSVEVFLQGSYKNDTNRRKNSDVDVVVRFSAKLRPSVAALSGSQLESSDAHTAAYDRWQFFRTEMVKALRVKYGKKAVTSGRKSLKLGKGKIPAAADVVQGVT